MDEKNLENKKPAVSKPSSEAGIKRPVSAAGSTQEKRRPVSAGTQRETGKTPARAPHSASGQKTRSVQNTGGQRTRTVQSTDSHSARSVQRTAGQGERRQAPKTARTAAGKRKLSRRKKQKQQMQIIAGIVILLLIVLFGIIIAASSSKDPGSDVDKSTPEVIQTQDERESEEETASEEGTSEPSTDSADIQPSPSSGQSQPSQGQAVNPAAGGETVYATVRLNVRSVPNTTGEILGKLEAGASIVRTANENGWSTVDYNGTTAYVSSEFVTTTQPQAADPNVSGTGTHISHSREWPKLADGSWDLANITNDDSSVAYGNAIVGFGYSEASRDPVTKIPTDWTYYEKNWGMFNVDWIQDPALPQNQNIIYLTMDEGFPNENTPEILRILKEKNVKATFFITKTFFDGSAAQVRQMIDEGHIVGNHSCTHPNMPTLSIEEQTSQIMTLHNLVKDQLGYEMKLFRFPEGSYTSRSLALVDNLGYKTAFWSYTYKDYDKSAQADPAATLEKVLDNLHNGAIYLLHADSSTNLEILPGFIDGARARGFEFGVYPLTAN